MEKEDHFAEGYKKMKLKAVSGIMLTLLLMGMLAATFNPSTVGSNSNDVVPVLWNKLGSEYEVTHSEIGPNGEIVGEVYYETCQHGDGFRSAPRTGDPDIPDNFIRFRNLSLGQQGCIEFWYHPDWDDSSVGHVINLIQFGKPGDETSIVIAMGFNDWQDDFAALVRSPLGDIVSTHFRPSTNPEWTIGEPFHMALAWDDSLVGTDKMRLYLNGVSFGQYSITGDPRFIWPEPMDLYVGCRMHSGDWYRHHWEPNIDGIIDNIKVWSYRKTDFSDRFYEGVATMPLAISILSPENKTYPVNDVPLTFTISEPISWISYSLDGQMNVTISGNMLARAGNTTLTGLSDGMHSLVIYASDIAGNIASSNMASFTIDTPPTLSIVYPEDRTYETTDIPLIFTVDESVSWMAYSLDNTANVTITGNTTLSGLSDGSHSLMVYSRDTAGNTGASAMAYFSVETPQPEPFPVEIVAVIGIIAAIGAVVFIYFTKVKK